MNKLLLASLLVVPLTLSACSTGLASPETAVQSIPDISHPPEAGWTNPHPGVYLRTVTNVQGNIVSESYETTTREGLEWLAEHNRQRTEELRSGQVPVGVEGDLEVRRAQRISALEGPRHLLDNLAAE